MKLLSDSYLYRSVPEYGKELFDYLMTSERVNKNSDAFADVIYDVKRQADSVLMKTLLSDKVVLLINQKGVGRPFKVIYAKDIKENKEKKKVFIDCTGIISMQPDGTYKSKDTAKLVCYLFGAMTYILYYNAPKSILANTTIVKSGSEAFVDMMLYVLGYLKVPVTFADNKERMSFVIAEYFQTCILGKDLNDGVYNVAKSASKLEDKKTCDYLHVMFAKTFTDPGLNLKTFLTKFAEVFLDQKEGVMTPANRAKLTVESFVNRWAYAYGPDTIFGLECFVPFSQILTNVYVGAFLNQQNTIEKIVGKNVVTFSNELLKVGKENA